MGGVGISYAQLEEIPIHHMEDFAQRLADRIINSITHHLRDNPSRGEPFPDKPAAAQHTLEVKDAEAIVRAVNALRAGSDLMVEFGMPSPMLDEAVEALEDTLRRHHYPVAPKEPTEPPGRELTLSLEDSVVTKEKMGG